MDMEKRKLTLPPLHPELGPALAARLMDSEVELLRSFTRHIRVYKDVLREAFPDYDMSAFQEFDSDMVKSLVFMQEKVEEVRKMAEGEAEPEE